MGQQLPRFPSLSACFQCLPLKSISHTRTKVILLTRIPGSHLGAPCLEILTHLPSSVIKAYSLMAGCNMTRHLPTCAKILSCHSWATPLPRLDWQQYPSICSSEHGLLSHASMLMHILFPRLGMLPMWQTPTHLTALGWGTAPSVDSLWKPPLFPPLILTPKQSSCVTQANFLTPLSLFPKL